MQAAHVLIYVNARLIPLAFLNFVERFFPSTLVSTMRPLQYLVVDLVVDTLFDSVSAHSVGGVDLAASPHDWLRYVFFST